MKVHKFSTDGIWLILLDQVYNKVDIRFKLYEVKNIIAIDIWYGNFLYRKLYRVIIFEI